MGCKRDQEWSPSDATTFRFNILGPDFERQWLFFRALLTNVEYDRTNVRDLCP